MTQARVVDRDRGAVDDPGDRRHATDVAGRSPRLAQEGRPTGIRRPTDTTAITASAKPTVVASSRSPRVGTPASSAI